MKLAILQITPKMLRELLQLPEEAEILDLRAPLDYRGLLEVKICGVGWETLEGQPVHRTIGTVTRHFDDYGHEVQKEIDWGFPASEQLSKK